MTRGPRCQGPLLSPDNFIDEETEVQRRPVSAPRHTTGEVGQERTRSPKPNRRGSLVPHPLMCHSGSLTSSWALAPGPCQLAAEAQMEATRDILLHTQSLLSWVLFVGSSKLIM